jgi:hypothetical protein
VTPLEHGNTRGHARRAPGVGAMSKIHELHPEHGAKLAPEAPAGQLMTALEQMASTLITAQLGNMFENADDVLFEMADKARIGTEKQTFLDTMRTVRLERPRIIKAFKEALHDALSRREADARSAEVDLDDLEKWTLQESSDLEEKIAVQNMDSKAASMYAEQLKELEQRLERLSEDTQGAVSPKALCPGRILDAFRQSMRGLEVQLPIKLVIYKLFDRVVVSNMGQVFSGANQMLAERGVMPKTGPKAPKKAPPPAWMPQAMPSGMMPSGMMPPGMAPGMHSMPGGMPGGAGATAFQHMAHGLRSEHLAAAMQMYGAGPAGMPAPMPYYGAPAGGTMGNLATAAAPMAAPAMDPYATAQQNAQLANEMLAVLDATGHGKPVNTWMPAQNLALVSRMFDEFYADPQLPEVARPVLSRLQFPVMKFAMSDPSFFVNPRHPVRELVHDVYDKLAGAPTAPGADFGRVEELVQDLLQRFDPDPTKLRADARNVHPVTEHEAERFLEQQRERLEQQKRALQEKIRRIVAQELRLHIGDRRVPKPVLPLILSGFGPMLVAHYRNGGQDDPGWMQTLALLDRLLASLDAAAANAPGRETNENEIITEVGQRLAAAGLPPARIERLADPLADVYEELAAAAPAPAQPSAAAHEPVADIKTQEIGIAVGVAALSAPGSDAQALQPAAAVQASQAPAATPAPSASEQERAMQMLLRGGDWFRVWCSSSGNCRWLKLQQYYVGADTVVFEDFGGENRLKMRAAAFVQDLLAGRSAPVDPDPGIQRLLKLLPAPAGRIDSAEVWFKASATSVR